MVRRGRAERVVSPPSSSVIELSDGSDDEGTQRSPVAGPGRVRRRSKGGSTPLGSPAVRRRRLSGGVGGGTQAVDLTLESDGEDEDEVRLVAEKGPVDLTHLEESPPREPWTGLPIRNVKGTPEKGLGCTNPLGHRAFLAVIGRRN